jgi:hypothetical protein
MRTGKFSIARFFKPDRVFVQYFEADPFHIGATRATRARSNNFWNEIDGNTNLYSQAGPDRGLAFGLGFLQR